MEMRSTAGILRRVGELLSLRDKSMLAFLLGMSIVFAGIEAVGISLVMPFITLATDPSKALEQVSFARVYNWLEFSSTKNFLVAVGAALVVFYLLRGAFVLTYTYALNRFTWGRYYALVKRLFSNYLALPYREFTQLNSSQLEKSIITEAAYLSQLIVSVLRFLAEAAVATLLYAVLLVVNPSTTIAVTVVIAAMVAPLTWAIQRISTRQGEIREKHQSRFYHLLNDAFGNFKLTRQMAAEQQMIKEVSRAASGYCRSNVVNTTVAQLPPTMLETVGMVLMVGIVLHALLTSAHGSQIIPLIAMYSLALYRIMPATNRMLYYYNNVLYYRRSLDIVYEELSRPQLVNGEESVHFDRKIVLENVGFNYPGRGDVFTNLSLTIRKNEKVAFIGSSGSGKTTLLDLLIGIHAPDRGRLLIDNVPLTNNNVRSWRRDIGYIPQNIFLFDGTVAENVAFGKTYNEARIIQALDQARIWSFLRQHEGLQTHVGEGGVKLSGGQKQRIGIARAIYGDPKILVLDEATSALDPSTAEEIMKEITDLAQGKTLIVVSHNSLNSCQFDRIYQVVNKTLANFNSDV